MKKKNLIITAVIVAVFISAPAFAWGPGEGNRGGKGFEGENANRGMKWQKLTDEQRSEIEQLHKNFIDDTANLRIDLMGKSEKLDILLETSNPDREEIKSLSKEIAVLRGELMEKHLEIVLEVKKIAPDLHAGMGFHKWGKRGGMGYHHPKGPGSEGRSCGRY